MVFCVGRSAFAACFKCPRAIFTLLSTSVFNGLGWGLGYRDTELENQAGVGRGHLLGGASYGEASLRKKGKQGPSLRNLVRRVLKLPGISTTAQPSVGGWFVSNNQPSKKKS